MPLRRFKYDGRHERVRCPQGKVLKRSYRTRKGWIYTARVRDCGGCPLQSRCVSPGRKARTVLIVEGYEALLRARRFWSRMDEARKHSYERHRWRVEGKHGVAKTQHGLRRAVRRGLANVTIQVFLTATVMNLKRLVASLRLFSRLGRYLARKSGVILELQSSPDRFSGHDPEIKSHFDAAA